MAKRRNNVNVNANPNEEVKQEVKLTPLDGSATPNEDQDSLPESMLRPESLKKNPLNDAEMPEPQAPAVASKPGRTVVSESKPIKVNANDNANSQPTAVNTGLGNGTTQANIQASAVDAPKPENKPTTSSYGLKLGANGLPILTEDELAKEAVASNNVKPGRTVDIGSKGAPSPATLPNSMLAPASVKLNPINGSVTKAAFDNDDDAEQKSILDNYKKEQEAIDNLNNDYDARRAKYNQFLEDYEKKSAEDEKSYNRNKLWASIGDGISALSNLYFTSKGAPNMYNADDSMSKANQDRYERLRKLRKEDHDRWINSHMQGMNMLSKELTERRQQMDTKRRLITTAQKLDNDAKKYELLAKQAEEKGNLMEAQINWYKARESAENSKAAWNQAKAEWVAPEAQSRIRKNEAQATKALNSGSGSGEGGSGKHYTTWNGKRYHDQAEYEADVRAQAAQKKVDTDIVEKDRRGRVVKRTPKPISQIRAEIDAKNGEGKGRGY